MGCNRSTLPDFINDLLPASLTGLHQKQAVENYIGRTVARWDTNNAIDVELTCGYGPALHRKLYEFKPKGSAPCWQLQYYQDPATQRLTPYQNYAPPFGILKLDMNDSAYFDSYVAQLMLPDHLDDFGTVCFGEEQDSDFQARLLQSLCDLKTQTTDVLIRDPLDHHVRMIILTHIMGRTLTITEHTVSGILDAVTMSPKPVSEDVAATHVSPRLANRQLKLLFSYLRRRSFYECLGWLQQTLCSADGETSWLPGFYSILCFAIVLEETQQSTYIGADFRSREDGVDIEDERRFASEECEQIDSRFRLMVALFRFKYRDYRWDNGIPELQDPHAREFVSKIKVLLFEKRLYLESRRYLALSSRTQCSPTSRLVARFLLPFLHDDDLVA
ncbi:hypothetical protein LTR17_018997 [Elasticomyces elasticus]|nr:hypothetical protein LTR17_018997 [Elasticomyces elasticus]